jgi:hypothetical protein
LTADFPQPTLAAADPVAEATSGVPEGMTGSLALYKGSGTVYVCQAVDDIYREKYVVASCGNNGAGAANNTEAYSSDWLIPQVENGSPFAHTIEGYYYTH